MNEKPNRLTIADACALTGATPMTVYNWRNKRTDKTKLPCVVKAAGQRGRVFFKPKAFAAWCQRNEVAIVDKKLARQFGIETKQ